MKADKQTASLKDVTEAHNLEQICTVTTHPASKDIIVYQLDLPGSKVGFYRETGGDDIPMYHMFVLWDRNYIPIRIPYLSEANGHMNEVFNNEKEVLKFLMKIAKLRLNREREDFSVAD